MAVAAYFGGRIPLDDIVISDRQRSDVGDIGTLMQSIKTHGLLSPIIIERGTKQLVAGGRRLASFKALRDLDPDGGWGTIPFRNYEALAKEDLKILELHENIMRLDLTWQERVKATAALSEMMRGAEPGISEGLLAERIGISANTLMRTLAVHQAMKEENAVVLEASTFTEAYNASKRAQDRATDTLIAGLLQTALPGKMGPKVEPLTLASPVSGTSLLVAAAKEAAITPILGRSQGLPTIKDPDAPRVFAKSILDPAIKEIIDNPPPLATPILCDDFAGWALEYAGEPFNLLHCDFPYGIDFDKHAANGAPKDRKKYADSKDVYTGLCTVLRENYDTLVSSSAQIIFWFSMKYYQETLAFLRSLPDTDVDEFPLIWSRNRGILPRHGYGPRRNYETAFFAYSGVELYLVL